MGELADRARRLLTVDDKGLMYPGHAELVDRIDRLERELAEMRRPIAVVPTVVVGDRFEVDDLQEAMRRFSGERPTLSDRLVAAERTNAIVLDAVTRDLKLRHMVGFELKPGLMTSHTNRVQAGDFDWRFTFECGANCEGEDVYVAVLVPTRAPDPTLLERRATELIEAGEALLMEYEKQRVATADVLT